MHNPNSDRDVKAIGNLIKLRSEQGDRALFTAIEEALSAIYQAHADLGDEHSQNLARRYQLVLNALRAAKP